MFRLRGRFSFCIKSETLEFIFSTDILPNRNLMYILVSLYVGAALRNQPLSSLLDTQVLKRGGFLTLINYTFLTGVCILIQILAKYFPIRGRTGLRETFALMARVPCSTSLPPFAFLLGANPLHTFRGTIICYISSIFLFPLLGFFIFDNITPEASFRLLKKMATLVIRTFLARAAFLLYDFSEDGLKLITKFLMVLINGYFFSKLTGRAQLRKKVYQEGRIRGLLIVIRFLFFRFIFLGVILDKLLTFVKPNGFSIQERINIFLFGTMKSDSVSLLLAPSIFTEPVLNPVNQYLLLGQFIQTRRYPFLRWYFKLSQEIDNK